MAAAPVKPLAATDTMQLTDSDNPAPPPPPPVPHTRRPRVREVSSRFMSPAASSSQRRQHRADSDLSGDENSESSFPIANSVAQRKQRAAMKLFRESNGVVDQVPNHPPHPPHPSKSCSSRIGIGIGGSGNTNNPNSIATPSRPDTPTPSVFVPSRFRLTPHHHNNHNHSHSHSHHRSINGSASVAAKLMQASGMSQSLSKANAAAAASALSQLESNSRDDSAISCSTQSLPELCSENDRDRLTLNDAAKIGNSGELKSHPSPLSRSVTLPASSSEHLLLVKGSEKQPASVSNHVKLGGLSLPPVAPQCARPALDTRKGRKGSSHQEDVHSLRLLHNRYLQWRFANAKAAASMKAQQKESEKALYSHAMKISEMRDSVNRKRAELELLQRYKTLSTILDAQMPYLEEWSSMEEDYSVSLTEATQALVNASVQLPVGGNVRVDEREVGEALNSASKMMETIVSNIQRLVPKAEETDSSISELARVVGGERALIGESGDLLSKTYKSQVEECSLRGQLIQLHSICQKNKNKEQQESDN
ncbi:protein ENDOSPERM DEFECTIVE 1-like [Lotus japonicus]|uniref:protein ENDOSPERM DEFECTIVE 1-like n=1 Tax=Lotus japonicus TaxID=34305 RepID=UPI002587BDF0|nr:protein ENDOSPERM DEFECTIVE 1-like [Lotus japonicus]